MGGMSFTIVQHFLLTILRYPYPLFELLDTPGRIGLFSVSAIVMALNTATLKWLYGRVNGFGGVSAPKARPGVVKQ
jgi:hypothetical protein